MRGVVDFVRNHPWGPFASAMVIASIVHLIAVQLILLVY